MAFLVNWNYRRAMHGSASTEVSTSAEHQRRFHKCGGIGMAGPLKAMVEMSDREGGQSVIPVMTQAFTLSEANRPAQLEFRPSQVRSVDNMALHNLQRHRKTELLPKSKAREPVAKPVHTAADRPITSDVSTSRRPASSRGHVPMTDEQFDAIESLVVSGKCRRQKGIDWISMVKELDSIELFKGVFDKLEQNKEDRYAKSKWLNNGHARINSRRGKAKSDASTSPGNLATTEIATAGYTVTELADASFNATDLTVNGDINVEAIEFTTQHGASIYEVNAESELLKGPIGDEGDSGEKGEPGATRTTSYF
jgi:hypothetical protein